MNVNPLEVVVNDPKFKQSYNRIHAAPISSRYSAIAQQVYAECYKGRNYSCIGKSMGLGLSVISSCIALVETIASLAYATLMTLVHTLTLFRSTSLQNHLLKSWAFCRHSSMTIFSPFLIANQSKSTYEIALRQYFTKIDCAQAAQSIGTVFDTLACRRKGLQGVSSTQIRNIEISIEGFTQLINDVKWQMPKNLLGNAQENFEPMKLPKLSQFKVIKFLKNSAVKNNQNYANKFYRIGTNAQDSKAFIEGLTALIVLHYNEKKKKHIEFEEPVVKKVQVNIPEPIEIDDPIDVNDVFFKGEQNHQNLLRQQEEEMNLLRQLRERERLNQIPRPKFIDIPEDEDDIFNKPVKIPEPVKIIEPVKKLEEEIPPAPPLMPLPPVKAPVLQVNPPKVVDVQVNPPKVNPPKVNPPKVVDAKAEKINELNMLLKDLKIEEEEVTPQAYDQEFIMHVNKAALEIYNNYVDIVPVNDPLENLSKQENLKEAIQGLENIHIVIGLAQLFELEQIQRENKITYPEFRNEKLKTAFIEYNKLKGHEENKDQKLVKFLLRKVLQDPKMDDEEKLLDKNQKDLIMGVFHKIGALSDDFIKNKNVLDAIATSIEVL